MADQPYVAPDFVLAAYHCPYADCGTYAQQVRAQLVSQHVGGIDQAMWWAKMCAMCSRISIWRSPTPAFDAETRPLTLIYPAIRLGVKPHVDMPADAAATFGEALDVQRHSPRAAAALLRLALQQLIDILEPGAGTIDAKIGTLVGKGLDLQIANAMDVLRVVGNNAVHPGQIDVGDDPALVPALFGLINLIVEQMIARPKHIAALMQGLPATNQAAIQARNTKAIAAAQTNATP